MAVHFTTSWASPAQASTRCPWRPTQKVSTSASGSRPWRANKPRIWAIVAGWSAGSTVS